jgi:hypothetical protein
MKAQFTVRTVLLHITLIAAGVSFALANEVISIGTILKNAESYNLRVVTIQGTVRDVKPFEPYFEPFMGTSGICYGAYTFILEDGTGAITLDHTVLCRTSRVLVPEVSEGEKVIVDAQILAPGRYIEQGKVFSEERQTAQAVVKNIRAPSAPPKLY